MADKKISALTAATIPLAGTEVLPIVQSGSTVKVANNDLRPKQIQSNATSGVLQVVGPAAAATRVMTVPDANFTAARTDAAQTFTGAQTFSDGVVANTFLGVNNSSPGSGGRSGNDGVLGLGSTSTLLSNYNYTVAQNEYVDITIATGSDGFAGLLIINNSLKSNANTRTQSVYAVFGRGTDAAFAANSLSSANGTGGAASFTISNPSTGVVRVTNTYAGTTALVLTFIGNLGW